MKFNTENSLKRFLKRKVKITLGLVVAFMITGTVGYAKYTEPIIATDEKNPIDKDDILLEMDISDYNEQWTENGAINSQNYAIFAANKGVVNVDSKNIKIVTINITELHPEIKNNYSYGIRALGNGIINLGNDNTQQIDITTTTDYFGIGVYADKLGNSGGKIDITADTVNITANGIGSDGDAYGIYCITRTENAAEENKSNVNIKAKNTTITATSEGGKSIGIAAWSEGKVKINDGNVTITADDVIHTRLAEVGINADNKIENIVKLTGDIKFEYSDDSKTTVDSDITVNLANKDSVFTGKIYSSIKSGKPADEKLKYTGMKLGLSNGATWNVTGDSYVNDLTFNDGIINVKKSEEVVKDKVTDNDIADYTGINDGQTVINVENLKGKNKNSAATGTIKFETTVEDNKLDIASGVLKIKNNIADNSSLKIGFSDNITADELVKNNINLTEVFEELSKKVITNEVNKDKIEQTYFAKEGLLNGEITAEKTEDGKFNITQEKESKTVIGLKDLATINYLSWKQEMGSLTQRMGELRNSSADHGVWARVYGGKVENGSQYDNEYQTYQVGYDKKYSVNNGNVFLGYLVSYTDGETNYSLGNGENYSVGAGIYATWMNNNGHYVDVLYKVSRLNNKFDVGSSNNALAKSSGEYDTYGISLSAEYGKRFDITEKWFAEPSVGMHFGRLGDETYTTSSGVEVSQDSIYTAEGRIGTALGYKFSDKGNVYARAHVVKEFAGDIDAEYKIKDVTNSTSEDLSDTWLEFGIGANYRVRENVNVYADIEKTGDATVDTEWQGNLGFRWEF